MIQASFQIHKCVVNIGKNPDPIYASSQNFGNKLSILSGDYLLASACRTLASLESSQVS